MSNEKDMGGQHLEHIGAINDLVGILKGNGTSAPTVATPDTDYLLPATAAATYLSLITAAATYLTQAAAAAAYMTPAAVAALYLTQANAATTYATLAGVAAALAGYQPLGNYPRVLATVDNIDATAVATTNLFTVPPGKTCVPLYAVLRLKTIAGFITVGTGKIDLSTGTIIFAPLPFTGISAVDQLQMFNIPLVSAPASSVIRFNNTIGYVAGTATFSLDLVGYLI